MFIKNDWIRLIALCLMLAAFPQGSVSAKTIEIEENVQNPTTAPASSAPLTLAPVTTSSTSAVVHETAPLATAPVSSPETVIAASATGSSNVENGDLPQSPKVRAPQDLSFYSFLMSGFVVQDGERVEALGKVAVPSDGSLGYAPPQKAQVLLADTSKCKVGDIWTVYHLEENILDEPELNFQGSLGDIRAVIQVEEITKNFATVNIIQSFRPFEPEDQVRDYALDVKRWKRAQTKKPLPSAEIRCFVAGGSRIKDSYDQLDTVILTAGTRKGLVEGMKFDLDQKTDEGAMGGVRFNKIGTAEVFYCGTTYSLARILQSQDGIQKGFTAIYRP